MHDAFQMRGQVFCHSSVLCFGWVCITGISRVMVGRNQMKLGAGDALLNFRQVRRQGRLFLPAQYRALSQHDMCFGVQLK